VVDSNEIGLTSIWLDLTTETIGGGSISGFTIRANPGIQVCDLFFFTSETQMTIILLEVTLGASRTSSSVLDLTGLTIRDFVIRPLFDALRLADPRRALVPGVTNSTLCFR